MKIYDVWSDRPEVPLYGSRNLQQFVWIPAALVFMDDCWSPVQHIAHAPAIGDKVDFTDRGVFALGVDEISHGTAYTALTPFHDMSYSQRRQA
jgi:hypothetical protein